MPELIEVEQYRVAAAVVVGRVVAEVRAPDPWFLKRGLDPRTAADALRGVTVVAARRRGKLLVLDTDGPRVGLRFGMTGRLLVDGATPITELEYGSTRDEPAWDRFALHFIGGGGVVMRDPRRLGGVELDPDEKLLGPDAASVSRSELLAALDSSAAVKARLLDQGHIAGIGNLICDETLWRAGIDPARSARSLSADEATRLLRDLRATIRILSRRGGSHTGDLQGARVPAGRCPRDATPLLRRTVAGRTTYSCPAHQR